MFPGGEWMSRWRMIVLFVMAASVLLPARVGAQRKKKQDVFKPVRFFVGSWEGRGEGRPGVSKVEREYEFVLQDKFLEAKNKSVYEPQKDNPEGEIHEDWGFFSYDENTEKLVFRQFHAEGFVNHYVLDSLSADGKTLVFTTEAIENFWPKWRARETYRILNDNEFTETFELAPPDFDFELYMTNHFKRKP
jgi:hypothetical protein